MFSSYRTPLRWRRFCWFQFREKGQIPEGTSASAPASVTMEVVHLLAVEAARMIDCRTIIGVHYDTFGYIKIDHEKAIKAFEKAGCTLHLPETGKSIIL